MADQDKAEGAGTAEATPAVVARLGALQRLADWLDEFHVIRIMAAIGIPIALIAFGVDMYARWIERGHLQEERIAREEGRVGLAWQLLTQPANGNSGKVWAVDFLAARNHSMSFVDLAPPNGARAEVLTYLRYLRAPRVRFPNARLERVDLFNADLRWAQLERTVLTGSVLRVAQLKEASLNGADLRGVDFLGANLSGAYFQGARWEGADISFANISMAVFRSVYREDCTLIPAELPLATMRSESVWAWADQVPASAPPDLAILKCPADLRAEHDATFAKLTESIDYGVFEVIGADAVDYGEPYPTLSVNNGRCWGGIEGCVGIVLPPRGCEL